MSLIFKNGKMYGGNDVAANPTLTPSTRDLGSISIDGITYNVGGNTGTAYKETVLWEGSESTSRWVEPIVLQNIDIGAYDQIIVQISNGQHIISANQIPFGNVSGNNCIAVSGYLDNSGDNWRPIYLNRDIENIFRVFATTGKGITLTKLVGIKTGVGGGATSADWELLASVTGSEVVDISNYYARADEFNIVLKVGGYDDQVLTTTFPKSAIPESNGRISLGRNYCDALVKVSPASIQLYQCRGNSSEDVLSTTTMDVYYRKSGAQICFGFIDTTNVIVPQTNYTGTMSYTATQDCWVVLDMYATNGVSDAYIDGVRIGVIYSNANTSSSTTIPLRKGQTLSVTADDLGWYIVYGVARGSEVPAYDLVRGNVYGAFLDTNRLIKSATAIPANTDVTYTATEDCAVIFALINAQNQNYVAWIDGISFCSSWGHTGAKSSQQMAYLKKGQTIKFNQTYTGADGSYEVYGLSYGTQNIFAPQIYSLTEREVGTWIDNKPLYCKTIEISQYNVTLKNDVWANICTISDADYMVKAVVNTQSPNTAYLMRFQIDNGYLQGASNVQVTLTQYGQLYVTLYYTKSTDTAGSGQYNTLGMPMEHDSTTEHVVGTDENGETIYEITIKAPTMSWTTGSGYAIYQVDTSCITDSVKRVWWVKGRLHDNNDNRDLPIPYFRIVDSESIYYQLMQLPNGSVSLGIFVRSSNAGGYIPSDFSATIRYTKL